jgi:hypothetical protein
MECGAGETEDAAAREPSDHLADQRTAVALFDDVIDAEGALRAIERGGNSPEQVSLLVRAREVDPADAGDRLGAVARSLVATAMETVGGWLLGLAALVVPERGSYLVAGPLGVALTEIEAPAADIRPVAALSGAAPTTLEPDGLIRVLAEFGFAADEATYLDHRLAAGAVLIAVTSVDRDQLLTVRQLFSDHDAVHVSQGQTVSPHAIAATASLTTLLRAAGDPDDELAVRPLRRHCREPGAGDEACGAVVIDRFGDEAGLIDDLIVDVPDDADGGESVLRYAIVEFGGVLGLGRQHVVVPAALVDLSTRPVHVAVERTILHHAPRFAGDGILTRRNQLAVCAYFGLTPYWLASSE